MSLFSLLRAKPAELGEPAVVGAAREGAASVQGMPNSRTLTAAAVAVNLRYDTRIYPLII